MSNATQSKLKLGAGFQELSSGLLNLAAAQAALGSAGLTATASGCPFCRAAAAKIRGFEKSPPPPQGDPKRGIRIRGHF